MFSFAFLVGIYSFVIFGLGIVGQLYKENILLISLIFLLTAIIITVKEFKVNVFKKRIFEIKKNKTCLTLLVIFILQALINLIGVFGPEVGFDALWYHLTLAKIFIDKHTIFHIAGGLLYYSDLPKLGETLYIGALGLSNEFFAKFIHFSFGILTSFVIYKIAREHVGIKYALLSVIIFYSNLVVGWLSISAYVDLIRTFFEIMSFWALLNWAKTKKNSWFIESALLTGLSLCVKLTAFISVFGLTIFIVLFSKTEGIKKIIKRLAIFILLTLLIPLPYFVFSFINTGNPVYPVFQNFQVDLLFDYDLFKQLIQGVIIFIGSSDPISPMYLISIPLIILFLKTFNREVKSIFVYPIIAFIIIVLIPQGICLNCQVGDKTRFLLPYLSIFSVGIAILLSKLEKGFFKKLLFIVVIFLSVTSVFYRAIAIYKFVPYLLGQQTKDQFLAKNLNFSFGDFYDTDNFLTKKINVNNMALLYGFHNLYYINFPFIDSSWVKNGDSFNYIVTKNTDIPERFKFWRIIYSNSQTKVNLYTFENIKWIY